MNDSRENQWRELTDLPEVLLSLPHTTSTTIFVLDVPFFFQFPFKARQNLSLLILGFLLWSLEIPRVTHLQAQPVPKEWLLSF